MATLNISSKYFSLKFYRKVFATVQQNFGLTEVILSRSVRLGPRQVPADLTFWVSADPLDHKHRRKSNKNRYPYTVKKVSDIPGMSLTKLSLAGNIANLFLQCRDSYPSCSVFWVCDLEDLQRLRLGRVWLVTSRLGTGISLTCFLQCSPWVIPIVP